MRRSGHAADLVVVSLTAYARRDAYGPAQQDPHFLQLLDEDGIHLIKATTTGTHKLTATEVVREVAHYAYSMIVSHAAPELPLVVVVLKMHSPSGKMSGLLNALPLMPLAPTGMT